MNNSRDYPRDLRGYGQNPPHANWPNKAKLAIQFVINYEEGGENCILHGDEGSEAFLSEIVGAQSFAGARHMSMESIYEYGSRAGFWRLHRLFTEYDLPVTVFGVATALQKNPEAVAAMTAADWEIACHGLKWISYQDMPIEEERQHMIEAIKIHTEVTGSPPLGWYTGRDSPNTRSLVKEMGSFKYHADSYADDLPYWDKEGDTQDDDPLLIVPYTLDSNDMRFATNQGFNSGNQFYSYLKDSVDCLYEEGSDKPKMLSIGLHCRLAGRPGRFMALKRFIQYINGLEDIWVCRRIDIANHWHEKHPFKSE